MGIYIYIYIYTYVSLCICIQLVDVTDKLLFVDPLMIRLGI